MVEHLLCVLVAGGWLSIGCIWFDTAPPSVLHWMPCCIAAKCGYSIFGRMVVVQSMRFNGYSDFNRISHRYAAAMWEHRVQPIWIACIWLVGKKYSKLVVSVCMCVRVYGLSIVCSMHVDSCELLVVPVHLRTNTHKHTHAHARTHVSIQH